MEELRHSNEPIPHGAEPSDYAGKRRDRGAPVSRRGQVQSIVQQDDRAGVRLGNGQVLESASRQRLPISGASSQVTVIRDSRIVALMSHGDRDSLRRSKEPRIDARGVVNGCFRADRDPR